MLKNTRVEIVIPENATLAETIRRAAKAVHTARMELERKRTRFEREAQFKGQSRLVSATPTSLIYDVWLGKVESKGRK